MEKTIKLTKEQRQIIKARIDILDVLEGVIYSIGERLKREKGLMWESIHQMYPDLDNGENVILNHKTLEIVYSATSKEVLHWRSEKDKYLKMQDFEKAAECRDKEKLALKK